MEHTANNKKKWKVAISIGKMILLIVILVVTPLLILWYNPQIINEFRSLEAVNAFLDRYQTAGIFVYIGMQIIQILIPVIPGQMLQFAAGYMYHFIPGLLLSLLGIGLGTVSSFWLARVLGHDAIVLLFGEDKVHLFVKKLNSKRAYIIIFLLYLMPGFPKDFISFAAGVSEIRLTPFLILSLVGRTPALMLSLLMGNMTRAGSYSGAIVVVVVAVVLFCLFLWKRKYLMALCDEAYEKLSKERK